MTKMTKMKGISVTIIGTLCYSMVLTGCTDLFPKQQPRLLEDTIVSQTYEPLKYVHTRSVEESSVEAMQAGLSTSAVSETMAKPGSQGKKTPALNITAPDRKAVSWYYMKKKKGEVPNFPAETKNYKPNQKAAWVGTGKRVYLTLDVGGDLGDVDKMLKALRDYEVKATFFVTGHNLKRNKDYIQKLVEEGHLVLNHSITHKDFTTLTDDQVKQEFAEFEKLYRDVTGKDPLLYFRFPYGKYSSHLLDLVSELGYTSVFWSTAMKDWEPRKNGAEDAYQDIISNLHEGNIILMHQGSQDNINALDRILKKIKEEGYEFGLLTDLKPRR